MVEYPLIKKTIYSALGMDKDEFLILLHNDSSNIRENIRLTSENDDLIEKIKDGINGFKEISVEVLKSMSNVKIIDCLDK